MNLKNFTEGLAILIPYYDDITRFNIAADKDQFFIFKTDRPVSEADVSKLWELGWFQPSMPDYRYALDEPWSAFL